MLLHDLTRSLQPLLFPFFKGKIESLFFKSTFSTECATAPKGGIVFLYFYSKILDQKAQNLQFESIKKSVIS